jgi:hypothetical protein
MSQHTTTTISFRAGADCELVLANSDGVHSFMVCKSILRASSDYFSAAFGHGWIESRTSRIIV